MRTRSSLVPVLMLGAVALAACGGEDPAGEGERNSSSGTPSATGSAEAVADDIDGDTLEFLIPETTAAPAGYRTHVAQCELGPDSEVPHHIAYQFAVPEDWAAVGRSSAGSGTDALAADYAVQFDGADGSVHVDITRAQLDDQGNMVTWDQEPFTSFDYVTTLSSADEPDREYEITFEDLGPFAVDEQQPTLFFADQAQEPDVLDTSSYKAIVNLVRQPRLHDDAPAITQPLVLTVSFDAERGAPDKDVVTTVLGTLALPSCSREPIVLSRELLYNRDLDGDGKVITPEELLEYLTDERA